MKDQLKEVIQQYNKDKKKVDVQVQQELKVDKENFNGELKTRLIKVYGSHENSLCYKTSWYFCVC